MRVLAPSQAEGKAVYMSKSPSAIVLSLDCVMQCYVILNLLSFDVV